MSARQATCQCNRKLATSECGCPECGQVSLFEQVGNRIPPCCAAQAQGYQCLCVEVME